MRHFQLFPGNVANLSKDLKISKDHLALEALLIVNPINPCLDNWRKHCFCIGESFLAICSAAKMTSLNRSYQNSNSLNLMKTFCVLHGRKLCPTTDQTDTKMKVILRIAVFFLMSNQLAFSQSSLEKAKFRFTKLRNDYIANSKADILFLIDTSGSLFSTEFKAEKEFVMEFLRKIPVSMQATRVEVIPFGTTASLFINQVSSPASTKNKCTFYDKFNPMPVSINGWMTNTKGAFQLAYDVCVGKYSGQKRGPLSKVKTTVILLTDGVWNQPWNDPSPIPIAQQLHAAGVEVYAIGVGYVDFNNLKKVTGDPPSQAFYLQNFAQLEELTKYFKGGKLYEAQI